MEESKICCRCKLLKSKSDFDNDRHCLDGKRHCCRECCKIARLAREARMSVDEKDKVREHSKLISRLRRSRESDEKREQRNKKKRVDSISETEKIERNRKKAEYLANHKNKALLNFARARAKRKGIEFNIEECDIHIPTKCPILGIELSTNNHKLCDNSPSLDRIDSSKGYVKGNICVISHRANMIKSTGNAEEHRSVADFIDMQLGR